MPIRIRRTAVYHELVLVTPPEVTNTGPGFNRGSGGGARGCDFEERAGAYAHTEGDRIAHGPCLYVCVCVCVFRHYCIMAVGPFEI